jgi:hypothetical protein
MTKIVVAKRGGVEEIHKPGCADLKKQKRGSWGSSDRDDWSLEVETLRDLYESYWECIDDENVYDGSPYPTVEHVWWAWRSEFKLMPCAGNIPEMQEPGTEELPCPHEAKDGRICIGVKEHAGRHILRAKPAPEPDEQEWEIPVTFRISAPTADEARKLMQDMLRRAGLEVDE